MLDDLLVLPMQARQQGAAVRWSAPTCLPSSRVVFVRFSHVSSLTRVTANLFGRPHTQGIRPTSAPRPAVAAYLGICKVGYVAREVAVNGDFRRSVDCSATTGRVTDINLGVKFGQAKLHMDFGFKDASQLAINDGNVDNFV